MAEGTPTGPVEVMAQRLAALEARVAALETRQPKTRITDRRFLIRAFTVWGHYFVSNLIIGCIVAVIAMLFAVLIFGVTAIANM